LQRKGETNPARRGIKKFAEFHGAGALHDRLRSLDFDPRAGQNVLMHGERR
jgi:hypothetical protein